MADIETRLLSKIIKTRDVKEPLKLGVRTGFFHGSYRAIWKFVVAYFKEYGCVPHMKVIRRRFPKFQFAKVAAEPCKAIVDEIREREYYNCLREAIEEAAKALPDSTDEAHKLLMKGVSTIATEIRSTEDSNWGKSVNARLEEFEMTRKMTEFGIPTPWPKLNALMLGFQDQHLITVAGRPGTGKSWWIALAAYHAWKKGFNPLIITKEMAVSEMARRIDAIHSKVAYAKLRSPNKMEKADRVQYRKALKKLREDRDNHINLTGEEFGDGGVLSVAAKIDEYRPDLVFIDGVYLLRDDRDGKSKVEQLYNITQDMKRMAKRYKVPVIQTCQLRRGTHGERGGDDQLASLQWADSFGQDSDEVIKIYTQPQAKKFMYHALIKQREGTTGDFQTHWDFDRMSFKQWGGNAKELEAKMKAKIVEDAKKGIKEQEEKTDDIADKLEESEGESEGRDIHAKLKKLAKEANANEV